MCFYKTITPRSNLKPKDKVILNKSFLQLQVQNQRKIGTDGRKVIIVGKGRSQKGMGFGGRGHKREVLSKTASI